MKLTFDELVNIAKRLSNYTDNIYLNQARQFNKKPNTPGFYDDWTVGGVTGGNCWGGEPNEPISADKEPELEGLDQFLTKICPEISFLLYKSLIKNIQFYDYSYNEYYGNHTQYRVKCVSLKDLYKDLIELKIIDNA